MKSKYLKLINTILILLFTLNSIAQNESFIDNKLKPDHTITSEINERSYELYISLPRNYSEHDSIRYPVLYYLDGALSYYNFHGARIVLDLTKEIENVIIVGIGSGISRLRWYNNRQADYTPSHDAKIDLEDEVDVPSGGASKFLEIIKQDIIPFVDKQYKTTNDRGVAGNSLGSLFVAYCLFKAPDLFNRYGINSPSFWWQDYEMIEMEKTFSKNNTDLKAKVFVSVGDLEGKEMVPPMITFCYNLKSRNYEGLKLNWKVFDGESHISVFSASVNRTLTVLYGVQDN